MFRSLWIRIVRFGFRLLYNEMAWTYDLVSWAVSMGQWRAWQRSALPFVSGPRILELGHGPGHMLAEMQNEGRQVVGLDLSPAMGRLARQRAKASLIRGRAQQLPFRSESLDTVLSTFPTEYAASAETVQEVHRVLRANGKFIMVPEAHLTGTSPIHRLIEWSFAVTGQRLGPFAVSESGEWPDQEAWQPFQTLFDDAGFQTHVERAYLPGSVATILIASKA